jgi:hypothetical protein
MSDRRKSSETQRSRTGNRHAGASLTSDSDSFSIESTTMRLKSLRVRRAEAVQQKATDDAKTSSSDSVDMPRSGPSGRVRHDERGVAVWDWAVASGEFAALSTTRALKKLEVADLKIADHKTPELKLEVSGRDKAGGFDPYNQRGSGKRQGEAAERAGVTGSPSRDRAALPDRPTDNKK